MSEVRFEKVLVTLEVAEAFLEKNKWYHPGEKGTNRKVSPSEVAKWALDMEYGRWLYTPEPIIFEEDGTMSDGQHRMLAFVAAAKRKPGLAIYFTVAYGAEPEVFKVLNIGKKRRMTDVLSTEGYSNVATLHTVARLHFCYHRIPYQNIHSWTSTVYGWTNEVMLQWLTDHPRINEAVEYVCGHSKYRTVGILSSIATGMSLAMEIRPDVDVFPFMERLAHGQGASANEPAYELRERLRKRVGERKTTVERVEQWALVHKAFNYYAAGKPMKNLSWDSGGPNSFPLIAAALVKQEGLL